MRCKKTEIVIGEIRFDCPILNASGTWDVESQRVYVDYGIKDVPGALVTKGVTLFPLEGNKTPRVCETERGMINSIGLANPGIGEFLKRQLPAWLEFGQPVFVNIAGRDAKEFAQLAEKINGSGASGIEINLSCPNWEGKIHATSPERTAEIVSQVREKTDLALIAKLTPNDCDIAQVALAAEQAGADAISACNTWLGTRLESVFGQPLIGRGFGGVSGPAIRPMSVMKVKQICEAVKIPVIGMGGILYFEDALEYLHVGACAVGVGTGNFTDFWTMAVLADYLSNYLVAYENGDLPEAPPLL